MKKSGEGHMGGIRGRKVKKNYNYNLKWSGERGEKEGLLIGLYLSDL